MNPICVDPILRDLSALEKIRFLTSPMRAQIQILQMEFRFLKIYLWCLAKWNEGLRDEHEEDEKSSSTGGNDESMLTPVALADAALDEAQRVIYNLCDGEFNEEIVNEKLRSFQEKIDMVKVEIKEIHDSITLSFCFPRTNVVGFTDLLLENLKGILKSELQFSPSAKHKIEIVQKELLSLKTSFEDFIEQQNDQQQLKDIWSRIFNVPYLVDLAIKSHLYLGNSRGYGIPCLSNVTEEMKFIRDEIKKIQDQQIYKSRQLKPSVISSSPMPSAKDSVSRIDDEVVGFNDEAKTIIELFKRKSEQLEIICIFGMPGQGKTTLANKVYNDPWVQLHFHRRAWCCVSQDFKPRKLLLEILSHLIEDTGDLPGSVVEELEDKLRKCLLGRKYLIILDDIWDIKAWNALKASFPKENKGSKILFTSRENIAMQGTIDCIPYHLKPLSDKESWELLQKKIMAKCKHYPQPKSDVAMKITRKCKGLPLTVVLIAGLLADNPENLNWWNHIEEQLGSGIVGEVCKNTLELSYKHLPECLKPCFLYFGSFPEDKVIRVQKLIQIWISEQLIQKPAINRLEHMAKGYLMDLVNRSLVIVTSRSSNGGIKECRVHDLLREFCLAKGKEENFLHVIHSNDDPPYSSDAKYKHYRVCIHDQPRRNYSNPRGPLVHSLLFFPPFDGFSYMGDFSLHKYKLFQVLDLEEVDFDCGIPEGITVLVLLRYLAIWCSATCASIPHAFANLMNLESFRLKRYNFSTAIHLTLAIWMMKNLRHVDVGDSDVPSLDGDDAESCLDKVQTFKAVLLSPTGFAERLL